MRNLLLLLTFIFFIGCGSGISGSAGGIAITGVCKISGIQPNPVVDRLAVFTYQVEIDQTIRVSLFDDDGVFVATLIFEDVEAGTHREVFDFTKLAAGKYTLIFSGYCESPSEPINFTIVD